MKELIFEIKPYAAIYIFAWFWVNLEPLQVRIAKEFEEKRPYLYQVLSCWYCFSLWGGLAWYLVALPASLEIYGPGSVLGVFIVSFVAWASDIIFTKWQN